MTSPAATPRANRKVRIGPVELCAESFGNPDDPTALLIMGATASMLWWPEAFCDALSRTGLFVIRYDNRDTGQSTSWPAGKPGYTIDDMAGDAVAVLDAYDVGRAHVIGMSLGGMIAQIMALTAPERLETLTVISSAPLGEDDPDQVPIDPSFMAHFQTLDSLDWTDRSAVVAFQVQSARLSANADERFDAAAAADLAKREFDRALNPRSAMNHGQLSGGEAWVDRQGEIRVPALVIHGAKDPILSLQGGRKLAASLPNARLTILESGHELNRQDWPRIVADIAALTRANP